MQGEGLYWIIKSRKEIVEEVSNVAVKDIWGFFVTKITHF